MQLHQDKDFYELGRPISTIALGPGEVMVDAFSKTQRVH